MTSTDQAKLNAEMTSGDRDRIVAALAELNVILRSREADPSSLRSLTSLLDHEDLEIRREASWSIGKLAQNKTIHEAPIARLITLLSDADDEVRENAAWALGELAGVGVGDALSIGPLNRLLGDANNQVKGMAVWALGRLAERMRIADASSKPLIEALLNDRSLYVSKGAAWTMERIQALL